LFDKQRRLLARQRALLFAVSREPLDELDDLLRTAGGRSVGQVLQSRQEPDPDYYLGQGKTAELEAKISKTRAELLVCDDELSPRQERNLEMRLGLPVLDRTALILDIFALHAQSAEGKLQVEIAQIEYNMSRMRGLWPHLQRLGAGIGTRGPGETQIETDRRLARRRLADLRAKLAKSDRSRQRGRHERNQSGAPKLALFGYTNSGKSTLQGALLGAEANSADQLFHTLDSRTRAFFFDDKRYLLSDTVGLIQKLPHGLVAAFRGTLQEVLGADLLLHVLDARHLELEMQTGQEVIGLLGIEQKPRLLVFNKADLISSEQRQRLARRYRQAVFVSASQGYGIDELCRATEARLAEEMQPVELLVPWNKTLPYELRLLVFGREEESLEEGLHLRARVPKDKAYLFQSFAL
jgi:GTP-binding protein HflX